MRTRLPECSTVPSTTASTLNSRPTCAIGSLVESTPAQGGECSLNSQAWYFPALMRETSTHSTTKQERRYGISRRGARSRQTRSPSAWTDTSGLPSAPIACCMFSDPEQSNERASLPLGSRTAANEVIRDDVLSTTRARSLSAVSEAPTSEELGVEALWRGASDTALRLISTDF